MKWGLLLFFWAGFAWGTPATAPKEEVRKTVLKALPDVQTCYETALKDQKDLHGKLRLSWTIDDRGKATDFSVVQSLEPTMDDCVVKVLESTLFPKAPKGKVYRIETYPFAFNSTKASDSSSPQK